MERFVPILENLGPRLLALFTKVEKVTDIPIRNDIFQPSLTVKSIGCLASSFFLFLTMRYGAYPVLATAVKKMVINRASTMANVKIPQR